MTDDRTFDLDALRATAGLKLKVGGAEYPVRLTVDQMVELRVVERELDEIGDDQDKVVDVMRAASDLIHRIIREETPNAPDLKLDMAEIFAIRTLLQGGKTAAEAIYDAIVRGEVEETAPADPNTTPPVDPGVVDSAEGAAKDAPLAEAKDDPLASTKPSPEPSSLLEKDDSGPPTTGSDSPGRPLELTSA